MSGTLFYSIIVQSRLVKHLPSTEDFSSSIPSTTHYTGVMASASGPSFQGETQGQEFKLSLGYMKPCLNKKTRGAGWQVGVAAHL